MTWNSVTQHVCDMESDAWVLSDQAVSSKGTRSCQLTANSQPVRFILGESLRTKWGASTFDKNIDAPRRTLDFDIEDVALIARLRQIDAWAVDYIAEHSDRLLKKTLSRVEVENGYSPLVRTYGSSASVRTKINVKGARVASFWNERGEQIFDPPAEGCWQDYAYAVHVVVPQLWIMQGTFGLLLETIAVQLSPPAAINPFLAK